MTRLERMHEIRYWYGHGYISRAEMFKLRRELYKYPLSREHGRIDCDDTYRELDKQEWQNARQQLSID